MAEGTVEDHSTTVLIPCKNEEDNIRAAVKRMPDFGKSVELLFINDKSTDRTEEEIHLCQKEYPDKKIVLVQGKGLGKGEAVRTGMKVATGDICMILDADLTVIPEDLPHFYEAINFRRADFVHGTRFVYSQEEGAMRFANIIGNTGFSIIFSYILEQRTSDTLCGTKVFWRRDWPIFEETKEILQNSDLWGDYNLIFGASRFGLKIGQLPVRYFERLEGITKMNKRIKNGLIMIRVAWHALWSVKFVN
jgi:glycosyltransferase involved in cell wall biosynthesis